MNHSWFARAKKALQSAYADVRWDVLHLVAHYLPRTYLWLYAYFGPAEFVEVNEIDGKLYELRGTGRGRHRRYVMRELGSASSLGAEAWVEFSCEPPEKVARDENSAALAA